MAPEQVDRQADYHAHSRGAEPPMPVDLFAQKSANQRSEEGARNRARAIAESLDSELAERRAEPQTDLDSGWLPEPV